MVATKGRGEFGRRGAEAPVAPARARLRDQDEARSDQRFAAMDEPEAATDISAQSKVAVGFVVAVIIALLVVTGLKKPDVTIVVSFIVLSMVLRPEVEAALRSIGRYITLSDAAADLGGGDRLLLAIAGVGARSPLLDLSPSERWRLFGASETVGTRLVEALVPRLIGVASALYVASQPSFLSMYGHTGMVAEVVIIGYAACAKGAESLVEFAQSIYRVRTGVRRSPWFAIGAIIGALFFVGNDQLDLIPLSPTDALIKVTFGSQEKLVAAIDKSGIMENIDTTFAHTKDGMTINRTRPDGTQSDPVKNKADWEKTKKMLEFNTKLMWYVDLFAIAAACGFLLNTLMVRGFGSAVAGRHTSDD